MTKELLQQALQALLPHGTCYGNGKRPVEDDAIGALEQALAQQDQRINVPVAHELAKQQAKTDQSVTPEYLAWLESLYPARNGVGGNEAWNAGVAWVKAQQEQPVITVEEIKAKFCEAFAEGSWEVIGAYYSKGFRDGVAKADQTAQKPEDFCYCNENVSLQMVSSGGAPEGYLGMVTLRIGDQYWDYYTHPAKPLSDDEIKQGAKIGPVYAPHGRVRRHPEEYRTELLAWFTRGVRFAEAHIKGGAQK